MTFKRRLEGLGKRLEIREGPDEHGGAVDAVVRLLTDNEIAALDNALDRGLDPQKERQDVIVSPAEQAALERFQTLYSGLR